MQKLVHFIREHVENTTRLHIIDTYRPYTLSGKFIALLPCDICYKKIYLWNK